MNKKTSSYIIALMCLSSLFMTSCGPSDPVDKQLNKLEKIVRNYDKKAQNGNLTIIDLSKMNSELETIETETPDHITPAQEQRFLEISKRIEKLETNSGIFGTGE